MQEEHKKPLTKILKLPKPKKNLSNNHLLKEQPTLQLKMQKKFPMAKYPKKKKKNLMKIAMENLSTFMKLLTSMLMMLYLAQGIEIMDHFKKLKSRDRSKSGMKETRKDSSRKDSSTFSLSTHALGLKGADSSMITSRFTTMSGMREPWTTRTVKAGEKRTKKRMSKSFSSHLIKIKISTMSCLKIVHGFVVHGAPIELILLLECLLLKCLKSTLWLEIKEER